MVHVDKNIIHFSCEITYIDGLFYPTICQNGGTNINAADHILASAQMNEEQMPFQL